MNKFEKLIELNKEFNGMLINDNTDSVWFNDNGEILWNTDGNVDDLYEGDGDTYSGYVSSNNFETQSDGYILIEMSNDCGGTTFNLFKLVNKVE